MSDNYYKDKEYYTQKTSLFFGYIFKFAFIGLLVILVYRSVLSLNTFSFANLLELLQSCPDYLGDVLPDIKSFITYDVQTDGFLNVIGLAPILRFFRIVGGGIAYIVSCLVHIIYIIVHFSIGILF